MLLAAVQEEQVERRLGRHQLVPVALEHAHVLVGGEQLGRGPGTGLVDLDGHEGDGRRERRDDPGRALIGQSAGRILQPLPRSGLPDDGKVLPLGIPIGISHFTQDFTRGSAGKRHERERPAAEVEVVVDFRFEQDGHLTAR